MAIKDRLRLFLPVEPQRFRDEKQLRAALVKQDTTALMKVPSFKHLQIDEHGVAGNGCRYSLFAFNQVCRSLAPGLIRALAYLNKTSPQLAVKIFNAVLAKRFVGELKGSRLLVDRSMRRIDGLVGRRYQLHANTDLLEQCRTFAVGDQCVFHEAALEGRRLLLRYRKTSSAFSEGGQAFRLGWHFSNSETGDKSICVAPLFICDGSYAAAMPETTKIARLIHIKSGDFADKVTALLNRQLGRVPSLITLRNGVRRLRGTTLGLAATDLETLEKHRSRLAAKLVQQKIPMTLAQKVLNRAIMRLSRDDKPLPARDNVAPALLERCGQRTLYDLYDSLTRMAVSQDTKYREKIEQLAYRLLTNRFTI